jgi:hypothetical protein
MGAFREVTQLPGVRRIELGWGLALTGATVSAVAFLVYAYQAGGAALVAVYGVAVTLPAAVVTPLVTGLGDRVRRDRLLRWTTAGRVLLVGAASATALLDGPVAIVIVLAAVSSSISGAYRPLQATALPWLVRTPAELAAANVIATLMENAGSLLGPALAALTLVLADAGTALAVAAGFLALAMAAVWRLELPDESSVAVAGTGLSFRDIVAGVVALGRIAPPAGLAILVFAQTFVRGAMLVLVVVLALDVLALGPDSVGWLNAAMGLGGLAGGLVAASLLRTSRLGRSFVSGVALWGLPLVLVAILPVPPIAYLAFFAVGIGNAVEDAGLFTMMPRIVGHQVAGRALGALELMAFVAIAAGSVTAPLLVTQLGPRGVLAILGAVLAAVAAAYLLRFANIDRTMPVPGHQVDLLRGLPMFAPLPLVIVEQLATALEPHDYARGDVVMREGQPGDLFHIIAEGTADVTVRGTPRPSLGVGDGFGEIALLRDQPRTATVVAAGQLRTLALQRAEFLAAVTGNRVSATSAHDLAEQRLAADPPLDDRDPGHPPS